MYCKSNCSQHGGWLNKSYIPQTEQHDLERQMLFCVEHVTKLWDVTHSNLLPHPSSPSLIPVRLLSNTNSTHVGLTLLSGLWSPCICFLSSSQTAWWPFTSATWSAVTSSWVDTCMVECVYVCVEGGEMCSTVLLCDIIMTNKTNHWLWWALPTIVSTKYVISCDSNYSIIPTYS